MFRGHGYPTAHPRGALEGRVGFEPTTPRRKARGSCDERAPTTCLRSTRVSVGDQCRQAARIVNQNVLNGRVLYTGCRTGLQVSERSPEVCARKRTASRKNPADKQVSGAGFGRVPS
jgi:hypothetical protein